MSGPQGPARRVVQSRDSDIYQSELGTQCQPGVRKRKVAAIKPASSPSSSSKSCPGSSSSLVSPSPPLQRSTVSPVLQLQKLRLSALSDTPAGPPPGTASTGPLLLVALSPDSGLWVPSTCPPGMGLLQGPLAARVHRVPCVLRVFRDLPPLPLTHLPLPVRQCRCQARQD